MRPTLVPVLVLSATAAVAAAAPTVHVAGGERVPVLAALPPLEEATALAIAPDGRRAAIGVPDPDRERAGLVWLIDLDRPEEHVEARARGTVRDLLWIDDGERLLGLLHRPARRSPGSSELVEIAPDGDIDRLVRLPPATHAIRRLPASDVLLLAADDGIRTLLVPDFRTGPLFRLVGENRALAPLDDGRLLVGRRDELVVIDLEDPPGDDGMPIRERVTFPGTVVSLAAARGEVLARLDDGRVVAVGFAPLRVEREVLPPAVAIAALPDLAVPPREARRPRGLRPAPVAPEPLVPDPPAEPEPEVRRLPPAEPARPVGAPPADEPASPGSAAADAARAPLPTPSAGPAGTDAPPGEPGEQPPVPPPAPRSDVAAPGAVGSIVGAELLGAAGTVVLLGPDNILREAARVDVRAGSWAAGGLAPGRYRVQVEGGGDRVVVTSPPFTMIDVADDVVEAPVIRVLRLL